VYGAGVIDVPVDSHHISFETDRTKRFGAFAPEHFNDDNATRGGGTITVRMRNRRNRCVLSGTLCIVEGKRRSMSSWLLGLSINHTAPP
jgi:hypothetical protein